MGSFSKIFYNYIIFFICHELLKEIFSACLIFLLIKINKEMVELFRNQKLSYLLFGVLIGILVSSSFAFASNPIKLLINGNQIQSDVPPQMINGRVFVPVRFVAEALGTSVEWDEKNNAVLIQTNQPINQPINQPLNSSVNSSVNQQTNTNKEVSKIEETTFNGLKAIIVDGQIYFDRSDYTEKFYYQKTINKAEYGWDKINNTLIYRVNDIEDIIIPITQDDVKIYLGKTHIHSKYYREP